jgi:hypothetical protein
MKKLFLISIIILSVVACKKTKFAPEGPTDVRVRNFSDVTFSEVTVTISDSIETFGNIEPGSVSEYFRFEKAFPKAEISAKINIGGSMVPFSTGPVNTTYMQYIGQDRITYEVYISSMDKKELTIYNVIIEEPLVLK